MLNQTLSEDVSRLKNTNVSYNRHLFYVTQLELQVWYPLSDMMQKQSRTDTWDRQWKDMLHKEPATQHLRVTSGTCYLAWPWDCETPPVSLPTDLHSLDLIVFPIGKDYIITGEHTKHWHHFKSGHLPSQLMWLLRPKPHTDMLS